MNANSRWQITLDNAEVVWVIADQVSTQSPQVLETSDYRFYSGDELVALIPRRVVLAIVRLVEAEVEV